MRSVSGGEAQPTILVELQRGPPVEPHLLADRVRIGREEQLLRGCHSSCFQVVVESKVHTCMPGRLLGPFRAFQSLPPPALYPARL